MFFAVFIFWVFNEEQEKALSEYVAMCSKHYFGSSIIDLMSLAFLFAKKIGVPAPKSWANNLLARHWYTGCMRRHPALSLRTPEQTSLSRVKAFCKDNVDAFFLNLNDVFEISYYPSFSWSMDETGFSTVPSKIGQVLAMRGEQRVSQIAFGERGTNVTM